MHEKLIEKQEAEAHGFTHEHLRFLRVLDDVIRLDDDDHRRIREIADLVEALLPRKEG